MTRPTVYSQAGVSRNLKQLNRAVSVTRLWRIHSGVLGGRTTGARDIISRLPGEHRRHAGTIWLEAVHAPCIGADSLARSARDVMRMAEVECDWPTGTRQIAVDSGSVRRDRCLCS